LETINEIYNKNKKATDFNTRKNNNKKNEKDENENEYLVKVQGNE